MTDTASRPRQLRMCILLLIATIIVAFAIPLTAAVYRPDPPWPNGVVPFEFDPGMSREQEDMALAAMDEWMAVANVTFRPRELLDVAWVHFRDSSPTPFNYVGTIGLDGIGYGIGLRLVNIHDWDTSTVVHELGHVLGLVHEQNRMDRDAFIRVEWDNILGSLAQFNYWPDPLSRAYGSYDFDSIMQYSACGASVCGADCVRTDPSCKTMTVLPPNETFQTQLGQREHLSAMDQLVVSFLYPRANWRFVNPGSISGGIGSFLSPFSPLSLAINDLPEDGTIWLLERGDYPFAGAITKGMILRAPLGGAVIGR